jgi:hypothetical protein
MAARFTAFPPDRAALTRLLDEARTYRIGRDAASDLRLDHASVSRQHATLRASAAGTWTIDDDDSKNGLRVAGTRIASATFDRFSWFTVGDVYCLLEPLDAAGVARYRREQQGRRETSQLLTRRLGEGLGLDELIATTLDVVLELSGLQRGFVLFAPPGQPLRVRARRGLDAGELARAEFRGSVAAVDQALATRANVICCDTDESPWLGNRPSVRIGGLRALLCVPLRAASEPFGALYADSRDPGPALTELDVELIENVADHAATLLEARRLRGAVDELLQEAARAGYAAPLWQDLHKATAG